MQKFITFIPAVLIAGLFGCSSDTQKNKADQTDSAKVVALPDSIAKTLDPPDAELDSLLAAQPPVDPKDTLPENIALTINNKDIALSQYNAAQDYKLHYGFRPNKNKSAQFMALVRLSEKQTVLLDLFDKLFVTAKELASKQDFKDDKPGRADWPHQDKISYSWGGKQYSIRKKPVDSCKQLIHGLDCSGYFYQIFLKNGIDFAKTINNADNERQPAHVEANLQPYFGNIKVHAVDLHQPADFQSGDIIYFIPKGKKVASHIGIVLKSMDGHLSFFATRNGTDCSTQKCCAMNFLGGPNINSLDRIINDARVYGVVRVTTDEQTLAAVPGNN